VIRIAGSIAHTDAGRSHRSASRRQNARGVVQFDGARFVPWTPGFGQRLPTAAVYRLRTAPDGSVWLSVRGYLSRWKDGTLASLATGASAHRLADDCEGTLSRRRRTGRCGLESGNRAPVSACSG
jgi:hypothetical protein